MAGGGTARAQDRLSEAASAAPELDAQRRRGSRPERTALLFANVASRQGVTDLAPALKALQEGRVRVLEKSLPDVGQLGAWILEHRGEANLVIIGGGDGTLNAAADALVEAGLPLGILPLGTANDLARVLEIPQDSTEAARIIVEGRRRPIDLGRANDKLFFNIATMGLSARLARAMDRQTKRRFGAFAYALTLARIGLGHPFEATIRTGQETIRVTAIQIAVGNGRYHGGGVIVHEAAAIDDQLLHLYALEPHSVWRLIGKLPWLLRGKHDTLTGVISLAAPAMEVSTDRRLSVNTDGELTTHTPVRFSIAPRALEVFAPAASAVG
jgi:diacylglycerol kinase (ATP)